MSETGHKHDDVEIGTADSIVREVHNEEEAHESHTGESYLEVLTDPAHAMAELTYEFGFFGLGLIANALFLKWKLRKRDLDHAHCN